MKSTQLNILFVGVAVKILPKSEFKRNVLILTVGTGIAQGLMVVSSPVLTRLFTPEAMGLFAIFVSISNILSVIATGKYEQAIILPEKDEDAVNIVSLSIILTAIFSGLLFIIFLIFNAPITRLIDNEEISFWLYFIPANVFFICLFFILSNWLTRKKLFRNLAVFKVTKSFFIVGISILLGIFQFGAAGLIIGTISGFLVASMIMLVQIWLKETSNRQLISSTKMKNQAKRYKDFPRYTVPSNLLNALAIEMPVILFGVLFSPLIAGLYSLTQRVLGVPVTIISKSVYEVFSQRAASDYAEYGNCRRIFLKTLKALVLFSFIPFALLFIFAPDLFSLVFGEKWRDAGLYARVLSFYYFLAFNSVPFHSVFIIAEKQRNFLLGRILFLMCIISAFIIGVLIEDEFYSVVSISVLSSIVYLTYILLSYKYSKGVRA